MSLSFGSRINARIGAKSPIYLKSMNVRAFQSLSSPPSSTSGDEKKSSHPTVQSVDAVQFSSLAKISSSLTRQKPDKFLSQTTRSMAGNAPVTHRDGKPTLEYAKTLPKTYASKSNSQVLAIAQLGVPEACRECVVRDIMSVDNVEYDEALKTFDKIAKTNREGMAVAALPFYTGFGVSFTAAFISIPLVFDLESVRWFNEQFVTADLPDSSSGELDTWMEVGSVSWSWMEPVLGQVSFFLLCMQFARSQLKNLGLRPYFNWQRDRRASYLIQQYPQYDAQFLAMYSKSDVLADAHELAE